MSCVIGSGQHVKMSSSSVPSEVTPPTPGFSVLCGVPSRDSSLPAQKRNLEMVVEGFNTTPPHPPPRWVSGHSLYWQQLEFHNKCSSQQGAGGSQALPAKSLKQRGIVLGEGGGTTFLPLNLHPKATGVLLTSQKKRLTADSSDGNECAEGPGGQPPCAGSTPRATRLRIPGPSSHLP